MAEDFSFSIKENFGVLSKSKAGWTMELNLVSWGENAPKYDIRSWDPEHAKMSKGVTLKKEEVVELKKILNSINLD